MPAARHAEEHEAPAAPLIHSSLLLVPHTDGYGNSDVSKESGGGGGDEGGCGGDGGGTLGGGSKGGAGELGGG